MCWKFRRSSQLSIYLKRRHSWKVIFILIVISVSVSEGMSHLNYKYLKYPHKDLKTLSSVRQFGNTRIPPGASGLSPLGGLSQINGFNVTFTDPSDSSDSNNDPSAIEIIQLVIQIVRMIIEMASMFGMDNALEIIAVIGMLIMSFVITTFFMLPLFVMMPIALLVMTLVSLLPLISNFTPIVTTGKAIIMQLPVPYFNFSPLPFKKIENAVTTDGLANHSFWTLKSS